MDDKTLQRKLNQFVKLGMELHDEAKRRYGPSGSLFHEGDGGVYIMRNDDYSNDRQRFVEYTAKGSALWGCGAW